MGGRIFEVMRTPGHSPGGICLLDREAGVLFSGDTVYDSRLFDELPGSDVNSYVRTVAHLRSLAGIRMVCPGHDDCSDGAGFVNYAMRTSAAAGKPLHTTAGPG